MSVASGILKGLKKVGTAGIKKPRPTPSGRKTPRVKREEQAYKKAVSNRKLNAGVAAGAGAAIAGSKALSDLGKDGPVADFTTKNYKVKKGDTLSEIAEKNGVSLKQLKEANPNIKNLNKIKPGQTIKVPQKKGKKVYEDITKSEMAALSKKKYGGSMGKKTVKRKAGGSVKPRGCGAAQRGFGKAMKRGK